MTDATRGAVPGGALLDLVGSPDPDTGADGHRAAAALRALARREDLKAAVLRSPAAYAALRRAAARYVSGETRGEALRTAEDLGRAGHRITVDHMGEDTRDAGEARAAAREFRALVAALGPADADAPLADASVSLDLSHVGLAVPGDGPALATRHLAEIAAAAKASGRELMISMEGSERTATILDAHAVISTDHPHVGVTLQAALHRTSTDLAAALDRPGRVRLVKGAYGEPSAVAHPRGESLDAAYARLAVRLVAAAAEGHPVSIATHDPMLLTSVLRDVDARGGPGAVPGLEVEMLHGVRPDRLAAVAARGVPTRVYLVYGHEWWLYLCHRLAENPPGLLAALADAVEALPGTAGPVRDRMVAASARPGRA
ncbi:MAG: proline dehydrogenase family protein [Kineosporiaceae bacterium]